MLGTPSLAITPTNLLYNVVATPGALYRYWRQGQTEGAWPWCSSPGRCRVSSPDRSSGWSCSGQRASAVAPAALASRFVTSVAGVTTFTLLSLYHPGAVAPDWSVGLALGAGGLAGGYTGARIQSRMPDVLIRRLVGILVIAVGAGYLWSAGVLCGYRLAALRERRDAFPAPGRVISGQVGKLIDQPC